MPNAKKIIDFKLTCSKCKEMKPITEFYKNKEKTAGYASQCKICMRETNKKRYEILSDDDLLIRNGKRTCRICAQEKSLMEFGKSRECKFGRNYKCKPCRVKLVKYGKEFHQNKYTICKERGRIDIYGLRVKDKEIMLGAQLGLCANRGCGKPISLERKAKNRACVDHCHTTNKNRGLLCHGCNVAIGFLEEGINRITGLAEYLQKHS